MSLKTKKKSVGKKKAATYGKYLPHPDGNRLHHPIKYSSRLITNPLRPLLYTSYDQAFAIQMKQSGSDALYGAETRELLAALKEFLSAKLEKTLADTESMLRATSRCCYCILYKGHALRMKESGLQEIAIQMAANEQYHDQVLSNIQTTAGMYSLEELQSMLSRAIDVQETGNLNVAVQLDAEESARALSMNTFQQQPSPLPEAAIKILKQ